MCCGSPTIIQLPAGSVDTIYLADGTLTANRLVNQNGFNLTFNNGGNFTVDVAAVTLTSATGSYTLGNGTLATNPPLDSDSGHDILTFLSPTGTVQRRNTSSVQTLYNVGDPVNGTTTAYYDGQLYVNQTDNSFWIATSKSTDPDTAATGSTWVAAPLGASSFVDTFVVADWSVPTAGLRTYTIPQATHGFLATGAISVVVQEDNAGNWTDVQLQDVSINQTTGDITLTVVDGDEFNGRAIIRG